MLSITLPTLVPPLYPYLCHLYLAGEGLELCAEVRGLETLCCAGAGVLASAALLHRGDPALNHCLPVGWHREAQCPALWHPERHPTAPGSESGMLPSGTCPFWLPSTCCMRPTPIPLGWICCFFPHGQVSWPLPWQVQDLGCPCCRAWFWELLLQKETGSPPNLKSG